MVAGMLPENTVNGVRVWRPMLPFGKDVVYDFAHKFGVPYFKDTTPSWSTRGKLRRELVSVFSGQERETRELSGGGASLCRVWRADTVWHC